MAVLGRADSNRDQADVRRKLRRAASSSHRLDDESNHAEHEPDGGNADPEELLFLVCRRLAKE